MEQSILPAFQILNLNTHLFLNALDKVTDEILKIRISAGMNNMGFIACHVLDGRFYLADYTGISYTHPLKGLFSQINSIDEFEIFPALKELIGSWNEVSAKLSNGFAALPAQLLISKSDTKFPSVDNTVLGGISFLLQHESYHIGQLALLRKYFGLPAMKY
ncbi:MAG: DinB family protein [Calditrichia bacterium]